MNTWVWIGLCIAACGGGALGAFLVFRSVSKHFLFPTLKHLQDQIVNVADVTRRETDALKKAQERQSQAHAELMRVVLGHEQRVDALVRHVAQEIEQLRGAAKAQT